MRLIADLVITTSLSASVLAEPLALPEQPGLEQHALLGRVLASQEGLERRETARRAWSR